MELDIFFILNNKCFDRFSFDFIFRYLLSLDFSHEEAKDLIINNCSLSALVIQERLENNYYKKINEKDKSSNDMEELKNDIYYLFLSKHKLN